MTASFKGVVVQSLREWCNTHGPSTWPTVLDQLPSPSREEVERVLPMSWIAVEHYPLLLRACLGAVGPVDYDAAVEQGRWAADYELTTFHRIFLRVVKPTTVFERAIDLWPRYQSSGRWEVMADGGAYRARLVGWAVTDDVCCGQVAGYITRLLEISGGPQGYPKHPECRARGGRACHFELA